MESMRRVICLLVAVFLATVVTGSDHAKHHPELPVLGYVTPWNPRGNQLVEEYRDKFDIVCPVWYTVHPVEDGSAVYAVQGGLPRDEDKEWYQRLQQGPRPLRVAPRFLLDGWSSDDYKYLIYNETRWTELSNVILKVVADMSFDGVVFESAATHAVRGALTKLSDALWDDDKILVAVVPPAAGATGFSNDLSEMAVSELTDIVDYFSIMTYDMYGPRGHEYTSSFPAGSQLFPAQQQHKVRVPGPNTSFSWIQTNLMAFRQAISNRAEMVQDFQMSDRFNKKETGQFLMGLPLYSYKYPVYPVDRLTGAVLQLEENAEPEFVIIRGQGEAVIMSQINDLIAKHQPQIQKEYEENSEYYFDYVENDGRWRVFMPTAESMSATLKEIPGVALWEIGQSSEELLASL